MLNTFLLGFQHCEVNLATSQLGSTCTTVKQPRVVPPRDMSDTQWYLAVPPGLRTSSCIVHLAHLLWVFHRFSTIWSSSIGQLSRQIETVDTEIALLHLAPKPAGNGLPPNLKLYEWDKGNAWKQPGGQLEATQRMHVYATYVCMLNMYVHRQ